MCLDVVDVMGLLDVYGVDELCMDGMDVMDADGCGWM
jgi:hypothetical protein